MRDKNKTQLSMDATLSLAALGVVFGDIGTSPLYAMRACLNGLPIDLFNVLGILSLIFWSLIIVISIKFYDRFRRHQKQGHLPDLCRAQPEG